MERHDEQNLNFKDSGRRDQHSWFYKLNAFADFIQKASKKGDLRRGVRVALIDDRVDLLQPALQERVKRGISFTNTNDTLETKPYYLSSSGHGTFMAELICRICPTAELYVARIDNPVTRQFNTDSAAKEILWAIANEVDIISMSWTLESENDEIGVHGLKQAIETASKSYILLFASARDFSALGPKILPADLPRVFSISAATVISKSSPWIDERQMDFILPGHDPGMEPRHGNDSEDLEFSFATASAAGLSALIIYSIELCRLEEWRSRLQSYNGMERLLQERTVGSNLIGRTEIFFNPKIMSLDEDEGLQLLGKDIQKLFSKILS